jgi:hypothetical protein
VGGRDQTELCAACPLTLGSPVERVTGIEPALSAWESDRSECLTGLAWASGAPLVTVMDSVTPGLMARQWPGAPGTSLGRECPLGHLEDERLGGLPDVSVLK